MDRDYFLITFDSTHVAMSSEAFFKEKQVKAKLVPLPSVVSSGCGFALKFKLEDGAAVEPFLSDPLFAGSTFYKITKAQGLSTVEDWVF